MGGWITHPTCKCNKVNALSIVLILRGNRGMNDVETGNIKQTPLRLIVPCSCKLSDGDAKEKSTVFWTYDLVEVLCVNLGIY